MKARLNALLARLGTAGVLAVGVLAACGGFWASALAPLEAEVAARQAAARRLHARTPYQPVAAGSPAKDLEHFYALFPASTRLADELERLHGLGRGAGLELAQGEYRLERGGSGLWAYRLTLPLRGRYLQVREFLDAVLKEMPIASIEALRFERKSAADPELEAQLRLTLHLRPTEGAP